MSYASEGLRTCRAILLDSQKADDFRHDTLESIDLPIVALLLDAQEYRFDRQISIRSIKSAAVH
jgi:hypothetical protein